MKRSTTHERLPGSAGTLAGAPDEGANRYGACSPRPSHPERSRPRPLSGLRLAPAASPGQNRRVLSGRSCPIWPRALLRLRRTGLALALALDGLALGATA